MNKKGFTLIELTVTIVILSLVILLVIPNVLNIFTRGKSSLSTLQKQQIESSFGIFLNDYCYNPMEGNTCPFEAHLINNEIIISPEQSEFISLVDYSSYGYLPSSSNILTNCSGNIKIFKNAIDLSEIECLEDK